MATEAQQKAIITAARVAGYHNDSRGWTRALLTPGVNRARKTEAFHAGARARAAGVRCDCHECKTTAPRALVAEDIQ